MALSPIANDEKPDASALKPTAVAKPPDAVEFWPNAEELLPDALALSPKADELCPVAFAALPQAVDVGSATVGPQLPIVVMLAVLRSPVIGSMTTASVPVPNPWVGKPGNV